MLCEFVKYLGVLDSNQAEFQAILAALELSTQCSANPHRIIIESDSINIAWARCKDACPWNLRFMWNKLQSLTSKWKAVKIQHTLREANADADSLAKKHG